MDRGFDWTMNGGRRGESGADGFDRRTRDALARLYDVDLLEDPGDLDLYLALASRAAPEGGRARVLELGVGTGRLAVPLAAAGHAVTGVDLDEAMLDRAGARAKAAGRRTTERLTLVRADMTDPDLAVALGRGRFNLAFIALNSLLLLADRDRQASAIRAMADQLETGGLAVVDVWLPDADDLARYDGRLILDYVRTDPETGAVVAKSGSALYDSATASVSLTTIYEEGVPGEPAARWIRRDRLRLVGADELRRMASEARLVIDVLAGDYELDLLGPGDDRAILVAVGQAPLGASPRRRRGSAGAKGGSAGPGGSERLV